MKRFKNPPGFSGRGNDRGNRDDVVEARGVEPLSENLRDKLSTGLVDDMNFPYGEPHPQDAAW